MMVLSFWMSWMVLVSFIVLLVGYVGFANSADYRIAAVIVLFIGIVGFDLWRTARQERTRRNVLAQWALERGYVFRSSVDRAEVKRFSLPKNIFAAATKKRGGGWLRVIDFWVSRGEEGASAARQIHFFSPGLGLPQFSVLPRPPQTIWNREFFGRKTEIDFSDTPASRRYRVSGSDEKAIRARFTPAVLRCLDHCHSLRMVGDGDRIVVAAGGLISPSDLDKLVGTLASLADLFEKTA